MVLGHAEIVCEVGPMPVAAYVGVSVHFEALVPVGVNCNHLRPR